MIKVGCCGFPVGRKRYFSHFRLVEVQLTFYTFPKEGTLKNWRKEAPSDFEFTLKASQFFTHPPSSPTYKRLKRTLTDDERSSVGGFRLNKVTLEAWRKTLEYLDILQANKVLFQTPPSFTPTDENLKNMEEFFLNIERKGLELFFEPRGKAWNGVVGSVCRKLKLNHVVDISEGKLPEFCNVYYFRIHGGKGYRHSYTHNELKDIAGLAKTLKGDVYILFNNLDMFRNALEFKKIIEREGDG